MLEKEFDVVPADVAENLGGPFVLIGHHGQGDPFAAEFPVDLHAGAVGLVVHAVLISKTLADVGHV